MFIFIKVDGDGLDIRLNVQWQAAIAMRKAMIATALIVLPLLAAVSRLGLMLP